MQKSKSKVLTLLLTFITILSIVALSFSVFVTKGSAGSEPTITGVKFSTIGAGANELKIYCTVSPATLKQGNYWEGSLKDVITQEELDAFTTKIKINGKTLKEWMDTGYIRYLPATSAGQLDIVFKNSGDFLTFEDELITFEKDCKLPGVAALTEDITYKFKFQSNAETTGEKVENTSSSTSSETSSATSSNTSSATSSTSSIITPPTNDEFDEGKITWTGVHYFEDTASGHYIIHLNVSPKTLVAGQKYYENGEVQSISEAQFNQFADYIFFNGYSFKDLIELDPEIFVTIQASAGRTDNVEFTLSPAALKKNNIPYYGTTQKAEKLICVQAACCRIKQN